MTVQLRTKHHLKFIRLKGGCTGSPESTLVKIHIVGNHMSRLINLFVMDIFQSGKPGTIRESNHASGVSKAY